LKSRLEFYNERFNYYVSNTKKFQNISRKLTARKVNNNNNNNIIESTEIEETLYGYADLQNKKNSINFNFKNQNKNQNGNLNYQNYLRFNDDSFLNIRKSLLLEQSLKQKHLTKIEDFEKYKSEKAFPVKLLKKLLFDDMKVNSNQNNYLYFMHKGLEPRLIDESFFIENEEFWKSNLKRLFDFFKCNMLYEHIPIYKPEYAELVFHIKEFLFNFYFKRYDNLDFYDIVYYTYCRNIIFSLLNYYKKNSTFNQGISGKDLKFFSNSNNDKSNYYSSNNLDYLFFFGHHRTQNSILKLLISIKNFDRLYEITKEKSGKFSIIANQFCGILKFELFSKFLLQIFLFQMNSVTINY